MPKVGGGRWVKKGKKMVVVLKSLVLGRFITQQQLTSTQCRMLSTVITT